MVKRNIRLEDTESIKALCNAAVSCPFEIDILSGNYIIDAKSIMGIFALDRSQPLAVCAHTDATQAEQLFQKITSLLA